MSYAIGYVIYGIAGDVTLHKKIMEALDMDEYDNDYYDLFQNMGFEFLYEGVSELWFGINIEEIDETKNVDLFKLINKATISMPLTGLQTRVGYVMSYDEKFKKLPEAVRRLLPPPTLQIIWHSS